MDSMETKKKLTTILIHVILIIVSITMLVPFIWMILTAFKTVTEATSVDPFTIFPKIWRKDAFISVINNMNFLLLYKNTLLLIFFRVVCAVLTATMAGYAFGRLNFKGRDLCFSLVLFQMMVPVQIFIIPQYLMVSKMGMLNTIFALVFPGIVTAFGTFLLRQGYMGLPKDLEEAARLDGCNIGQTFLYIMAPLTRSSMVCELHTPEAARCRIISLNKHPFRHNISDSASKVRLQPNIVQHITLTISSNKYDRLHRQADLLNIQVKLPLQISCRVPA